MLDGHHHPALGGAVELGDDQAGQRHRFVERPRLVQGVHTDGGVDDEQRLVRCAVDFLADYPMQFLEFAHQVVLGVQAAGSVDE